MMCCIRIQSAQIIRYDSVKDNVSALVILYDLLLSHHNKSANNRYRLCQCIVNIHDSVD
jgi:hypothetical protein